jgi:hypothetical protein
MFGAVEIRVRYVSCHRMPVYLAPPDVPLTFFLRIPPDFPSDADGPGHRMTFQG